MASANEKKYCQAKVGEQIFQAWEEDPSTTFVSEGLYSSGGGNRQDGDVSERGWKAEEL
jgi:hypothetical protein